MCSLLILFCTLTLCTSKLGARNDGICTVNMENLALHLICWGLNAQSRVFRSQLDIHCFQVKKIFKKKKKKCLFCQSLMSVARPRYLPRKKYRTWNSIDHCHQEKYPFQSERWTCKSTSSVEIIAWFSFCDLFTKLQWLWMFFKILF